MGSARQGWRRWLQGAGWLLAWAGGSALAALPGDLPFTRHVPDLEVYPQNFALAQDLEGVVYVGNTEGILTFDGSRWGRVPMPRKDLVRSLAHDGHGRIYVGGYDAFGYVERDAAGRELYHDLTQKFAGLLEGEQFADIWDIHIAPHGVFFRALRHAFYYRPLTGELRLWRHAGRFGAIGEVDGALLLQFRGEGLRRFDQGEWVPVPGSQELTEIIYELVPMPGGGALMLAPDGLWRAWRGGRVEPLQVPVGFPSADGLTSGLLLDDGMIALPSDDGSLYLLDLPNGRFRRTQLDPGYLNQVIGGAHGGLLIAGDEALYHVEWPAPWTLVGAGHGIAGSSHAAERWNGRWYVLGGTGVLRQADTADGSIRFEPTGWPAAESWDLLPLDERSALVADSYAVQLVEDGKVAPITHTAVYPRTLVRSRFDDDVVFVGSEPGVAVLRREAAGWKLVAEKNDMQNLRVLTLIETAPHTLWLGSERAGVWRVLLDDEDRAIREARSFTKAEGIEYGELPTATLTLLADGTLVALTAQGQYRWTGERFERFDLDGLDRVRGPGETLQTKVDPAGTRWAWTYNRVYRQAPGQPWRREEVGRLGRGAIDSLSFDDDGAPVFCSSYALLRYDGAAAEAPRPTPRLLLRSAERQLRDGTPVRLPLAGGAPQQLRDERVGVAFRFAMTELRRPDLVRYSVRLAGLEDEFSEWTSDPAIVYKRLPPGDYVFELRGRDAQGVETQGPPLAFTIVPRWYDTLWARALWVALALTVLTLLTLAVVRWRTARLAADRARLQLVVAERTAELELANRRLDSMAHLDGLTGIANRRRLDDYLEQVWTQCSDAGQHLSLLAIDVDRFKVYNDRHGHLAGDELLRELVRTLTVSVGRERELLARYGGDEFMVILPGVELREAHRLAERVRQQVETAIPGCTVSIGVAMRDPKQGGWIAELLGAADAALYRAKAAGRNRVVSEAEPVTTR